LKVLVAEDNPGNRQLLEDILRGQGYEAIFARDGQEALTLVFQSMPDLILLDINMPGLDGFEVCSRLKADNATRQIPILMLTALGDVNSRVKGLSVGADDYIIKPYNPRELVARIDAHLRVKRNTDELRATQERIRKTFERFVPPQVVRRLLDNPGMVQLGGQLQQVTVLFADLQGFSAMSERLAPEHLLDVLNQYHYLLVEHIKREEGTIDKFLGDGVMALYNTPLPQPDHTLRAVRTAINIQRVLPEFHKRFDPFCRLNVNFGIHAGEAVVGNVGTPELMDFTAIGDAVNIASRLQEISDNGQILISEETYEHIKSHVTARPLGEKSIRGREMTVMVYEVLGGEP